MEGVQIFNLQVDLRQRVHQNEQHLIDFTEGCKDWNLIDLTHMIESFDDTATVLAGLDLVISCDTSLVHTAGAIGVPCWMLLPYNPDWRWKLDGDTTEWYDSVRIFRQKERGNWEGVFKEVEAALEDLLQNK
jgi:ADP-heptose:LPS heptosyltransferase